jgi:signal transduction histidine kinase
LRYIFHEIRNPLNSLSLGLLSVIGGSESTRGSAGVANDVDEALLIMKDSVNYISDVLNDVLSMHKIEEGVLELVMQSFDMRTAVDAVRRAVKLHAESSLVAIDFSCTDEVPTSVIGDRQRFQHAFINILTHFINLAPERSSLRVACTCDSPEEGSKSITLSQSSLARRTRARLRFTVCATGAQVGDDDDHDNDDDDHGDGNDDDDVDVDAAAEDDDDNYGDDDNDRAGERGESRGAAAALRLAALA